MTPPPDLLYAHLSAVLRGERALPDPSVSPEELIATMDDQGISCLVRERLIETGHFAEWPRPVREFLDREARFFSFQQALRRAELDGLFGELLEAGIRPVLLKGFALAYTLYEKPHLRPSYDIDLFVRAEDRDRVREILAGHGYELPNAVSGDLISHEFTAKRRDESGMEHAIDVHWKIANPLVFSELLSYEECVQASRPIPGWERACTLNDPTALVYACVHRVAHHHDSERLIWLADIDRLSRRLTAEDWERVRALSAAKKIRSVVRRGLERSAQAFATPVPETVWQDLSLADAAEPGRAYLEGAAPRWADFRSNWRALKSPVQRLRYLGQLAFPPPDYMRKKYGTHRTALLPYLYARRAVGGLSKLFTSR